MDCRKLIQSIGCNGAPERDITAIIQHPSEANGGSIFVCLCGVRFDGHDFAIRAYQNGCRVFVAQRELDLPSDAYVAIVTDTRKAHALLACAFYQSPSHSMRIIGVTGTKGKTITAHLIRALLENGGIPCGYIGTNGVRYQNISYPLNNTTPDPVTLQGILREMLDRGVKTAVLEISSQAVYQSRIVGMKFDTCVYTNLYSDHVGPGEHPSFAHYKACKHRLFTDFDCQTMICNADDSHCADMEQDHSASRVIHYSLQDRGCHYFASRISPSQEATGLGSSCFITKEGTEMPAFIPMPGEFNVSNALAALAVATDCFGVPMEASIDRLRTVSVTGRSEMIPLPCDAFALIDYAHNGTSLYQVLSAMRVYCPKRLICLFGSVGERSQLRRRELGQAAAELCDLVILTSDNPGTEDPQAIIDEIAHELDAKGVPYYSFVDRAEAIRRAVELTKAGDILVLAGKGHENYQLIGTEKIPFSDREILIKTIHSFEKEKLCLSKS